MNVTLKLYATLSDYLPQGARQNAVQVEVADGESVGALVDRYHLPPKLVHLVLVNGVFVAPEARPTQPLKPGDVVAVWPPIAGG